MNNDLQDFIAKYKVQLDEGIKLELQFRLEEVRGISPHLVPIIETMQELSVGGKRLRAMLVFLGCSLTGTEVDDEVIKMGVMIEIFHLGLLIQDDFMDNDVLRRGVKTLITRYPDRHVGNFVSMLAGDYTFGWCIERLSSLNFDHKTLLRMINEWGHYFTRVGYGQTLDGLAIADSKSILRILELKSGEYSCVMPLVLGAIIGGGNEKLINKLRQFGMELGWVFQLRDDWLGEYGESDKTGKPVGNDSREGKHTYATMHGKEATEAEIKKHLELGIVLSGENQLQKDLLNWMATREN